MGCCALHLCVGRRHGSGSAVWCAREHVSETRQQNLTKNQLKRKMCQPPNATRMCAEYQTVSRCCDFCFVQSCAFVDTHNQKLNENRKRCGKWNDNHNDNDDSQNGLIIRILRPAPAVSSSSARRLSIIGRVRERMFRWRVCVCCVWKNEWKMYVKRWRIVCACNWNLFSRFRKDFSFSSSHGLSDLVRCVVCARRVEYEQYCTGTLCSSISFNITQMFNQ